MPYADPVQQAEYFKNYEKTRVRSPEQVQKRRDNNRALMARPAQLERRRANDLRRKYGITVADWDALFIAQGGSCAICKTQEPPLKKGWHTDHCHETGKVRGILCSRCNQMLGLSLESETTLQSAIGYLRTHNG